MNEATGDAASDPITGINWDDETIEEIAIIAHEANKHYCALIGDDSQTGWDDAPEWQRISARQGVRAHFDNPSMTPAMSHANWMKQKQDEGWQYGEVKDTEAKTHPCLVDYDQLPVSQRMKDYLFTSIVNGCRDRLLAHLA